MSDNQLSGRVSLDTTDYKSGVSELNRQIRVIESGFRASAAAMGDWDKTADGLRMRTKALSDEIGLQQRKISALTGEYQKIVAEQGADSRAAQELLIKINKQNEALGKMQTELNQSETALSAMGKESSDTGGKVQDLGKKEQETGGKTDQLKSKLDGLGGVLKTVGKLAAGLAAGVVAVGVGVGKMVLDTAKASGELVDMSSKTGISVERLQELSYAGAQIGTDLDTMTGSLAKMTRNMGAAQEGTGEAADAFKSLGIPITDANGKLRDSKVVFGEAIDALGKIDNETERDVAAFALFGKSAQELNPMIKAGSAELARLSQEARDNGAVMSEDAVAGMEAFDDTLSGLQNGLKGTVGTLATAFLPGFQSLADKGGGYLKDFSAIVRGSNGDITAMAGGMGGLITQIVTDIAAQAPKLMQAGLNILMSIIQAIVVNLPMMVKAAVPILTMLVTSILNMLPMLLETGLQIIITLALGIAQALPQLITSITTIIPQMVLTLIQNLPQIINAALQIILALALGLIQAIPVLIPYIPQIVTAIVTALIQALPMIIEAAVQLILALATGMMQALPELLKAAGDIIGSLLELLGSEETWQQLWDTGKALVAGLWEGIKTQWGNMLETFKDLIALLPDAIKKILGIASPSKVFAEIGKNMALGLGVGFGDQMRAVKRGITASVGGLNFAFNGAGGGGGGMYQQNSQTQNFYAPVINQFGSGSKGSQSGKRW